MQPYAELCLCFDWKWALFLVLDQEFGCQADMIFCGIFDGHGPWGHFVAKKVRESMPSSLLCNWQETLAEASLLPDIEFDSDKKLHRFNIWKHSYVKTCAAVDQELQQHRKIDSFYSGTTALTIVRQVFKLVTDFVSYKCFIIIL